MLEWLRRFSLCLFKWLLFVNPLFSYAASFSTSVVVEGLDYPWGMAFINDHQLLVTEKSGALKRINLKTGDITLIGNTPRVVFKGQGGLLDVVIDDQFTDTGWVFLSYSKAVSKGTTTAVFRGRLVGKQLESVQDILITQAISTNVHHYGSRLAIDGDGHLFVSVGDRGHRAKAQSLDTHMGKILRVNKHGVVPQDNPFVGQGQSNHATGALPEIYSYGHRNPQGMAYDQQRQILWVHEHGPRGGDELNLIQSGMNYGWPEITYGREYSGFKITDETHKVGMAQPVKHWTPSIAPSGMVLYQHDKYPQLNHHFLVGALKYRLLSELVAVDYSRLVGQGIAQNDVPSQQLHEYRHLSDLGMRIRDVEVSPTGGIYLLTDSDEGKLLKLNVR